MLDLLADFIDTIVHLGTLAAGWVGKRLFGS